MNILFKYFFFLENFSSDFERKKLQLEMEPPEFPIITIKSPVIWKAAIQRGKNRLEEILMVNHPCLQAINLLWHQLYV